MYQVLYRKYRPRVFSDVYGQEHVTSTLQNEIQNGRISHAYLFTGSRGTGKTTCAKILAKAVNCENSVNGEPCNECDICRGLDNGSIYDVVEIDAASNNGVDNIRDLREEANYTPTRGKYRVYIIDEVHMLSTGAFNALLKTLEEPPQHVIFILATTEVHKLPATILSRCQRFDFKRIQPETMAVRLKQVSDYEGIQLDDDAAVLIARIADGALRDGLSILDQCAGRSKQVTAALVSEVAGLAGREALYQLSDCIANKNSAAAMDMISTLYRNSYDMERLCVEMMQHFRNYLVVKTVKKSRELIICTDDEYQSIVKGAVAFTLESILFALDLFQDTLVKIKGGAAARIEVEMAFVKLCEPKLEESTAALLDRISRLERALKAGTAAATEPPREAKDAPAPYEESKPFDVSTAEEKTASTAPPTEEDDDTPPFDMPENISKETPEAAPLSPAPSMDAQEEAPVSAPQQQMPPAPPQQNDAAQTPFTQWGDFIDELRSLDITLFGILNDAKGYVREDVFLIDSPNPTIKEFIKKNNCVRTIKQALYNVTGNKYKLGLLRQKGGASQPKRDPLEDLLKKAQGRLNNIDVK